MKVIYTTCTYNHIPRAYSLAASVRAFCPDTEFIIGLIDSGSVPLTDTTFSVVKAGDLEITFLQEMYQKYSTLELNAALKPYFASHIFQQYKVQELIYLDSDILLFHNLDVIYQTLADNSIVLSPHALSSISAGWGFDDRNFLRSGIYNVGFYAVKNDSHGQSFLNWWMEKLKNECFIDSNRGMFAEQLWLNLVPLYFERVHILRNLGCNVAYWNLHEREITTTPEGYFVNGSVPLVFYHFSGATINCIEEDNLSSHQNRYSFTGRPDVLPLFQSYVSNLKKYESEKYSAYFSISNSWKTKSGILAFFIMKYRKIIKRIYYNK